MAAMPPPLPPANPYAAPSARVEDVVEVAEFELAERGTRLGAVILDSLIFVIPAFVLGFSAVMTSRSGSASIAGPVVAVAGGVAILALAVIDFVWLYRYGQTIAKRWLKIRIVRTDGSRCGLARIIFLRILPLAFAAGILNLLPPLGYVVRLVDALFIFRNDYRCVHDHIADTIVVKA